MQSPLDPGDIFPPRHIGPAPTDVAEMLAILGFESLADLAQAVLPADIVKEKELLLEGLPARPLGEAELLVRLREIADENQVYRSFIGMGYSDTLVPGVIQRNILENPGWYTQYTPYQSEISQGRLEALLVFQTMVSDLTGLPLANASLLDEGTAAAEAMSMCRSIRRGQGRCFLASEDCHPQTLGVLRTRVEALGLELVVACLEEMETLPDDLFGILIQYPATHGQLRDPKSTLELARASEIPVVISADLLALTLIKSPGELGADIAIGSTQRFGVPLGFGGPHAAYMATLSQHARKMPGRIVGVSQDQHGDTAYRLALQTREQHIRREKATSNICTAQVLLAIMAGMYAVYHGPKGLESMALRIHRLARCLAAGLKKMGHDIGSEPFFDTLKVSPEGSPVTDVLSAAWERGLNLRVDYETNQEGKRAIGPALGISLSETTGEEDIMEILECFAPDGEVDFSFHELVALTEDPSGIPASLQRKDPYLEHAVFHEHHSETEMLRYLHRLESKDLSLNTAMIPLGSCTMKLNPTTAMIPITWPGFASIHPFAPSEQSPGYQVLLEQLETWLGQITDLPAVSLQPNAGSQGEFAGLLAIRRYHEARGEPHRNLCLIPTSAHGTNAASAVIAGFECLSVACDEAGNVDLEDLKSRCQQNTDKLGALMITYPSTHGVFEVTIREICQIVHEHGGQVYMDGANLNAQVGLTSPGMVGADVCHINLHKTFAIPHGGGGPGMGPICAREPLRPFLPGDPALGVGAVSAAPYGSAGILPISWVYIALMGGAGLTRASQVAILNANYMADQLSNHYAILYTGPTGRVAHEFIIDCRPFEKTAGINVEDIAKRLMDFGFQAPTMSFPVAGTLMIEPTESESREELDRFCEAMITIRQEIQEIENGQLDETDNPIKNAPHTTAHVSEDEWPHPYSRKKAAWPVSGLKKGKYGPPVGRVDNVWGDRHLEARLSQKEE
ncbi:MAG: aminomethyl-transferring glycine dehydrogenase [Myxococcota bacterium]|nr:aminomethyl-transferring glycine dehydrogenase [Myxococcota bacterium]